jgi:hypothetical protein
MNESALKVIRLGCVGCGANLDISQQMERLACAHCGTQQIVQRSGGAIHLQGVAETLSRVQVGTDKTAAELAIARLTKERQEVIDNRHRREQYWVQNRNQKVFTWSQTLESKNRSVNIMAALAGLIGSIPGVGVGRASGRIALFLTGNSGLEGFFTLIGFLTTVTLCVAVIMVLMRRSPNYDPKTLESARNQDIAVTNAQMNSDLARFDAEIHSLSTKIQKQRDIANG